MPLGQNHGTQVGFNVQVSVDAKNYLIIDHDVTNEVNDFNQLERMASRAKEILQVDELAVLADKGYPGLLGQATTATRSRPVYRRESLPQSLKRIPPPIVKRGCSPSRISGMTWKPIATSVRRARS
jgi:hypothetical protein